MSPDPTAMHHQMVDDLLERGALATKRVQDAFRAVPRHLFLRGVDVEDVYRSDAAIPTRHGPDGLPTSSSSAPTIMAAMLEQLDVRPGQRILEVGAGTGYNAALLAHLVGAAGEVTTVDIQPDVVKGARDGLRRAGVDTVNCVAGDGWLGVPGAAPFDRVILTVGVSDLSPAWVSQLRPGGVLVAPLWLRRGRQASVAFEKQDGRMRGLSLVPCGFMRLRGAHAGGECVRVVGGWELALDGDEPTHDLQLLGRLLAGPARETDAPSLDDGWYTRLFLDVPGAVLLTAWPLVAAGWLDPEAGALVLLVSEGGAPPRRAELRGDLARAEELLAAMARLPPLPLETVEIEAWPAEEGRRPDSGWVLERRFFTFHLREP